MKTPDKIQVPKTSAGQRLDIFLAEKLKISRSQVQKMIVAEQIFVNNKLPKKPGDNLKEGSVIDFRLQTPDSRNKHATKSQSEIRNPKSEVRIIAETPDYVVVEKPVGMLSHPTMAGEKNTLANFIVKKYPEIKKVGDPDTRSARRLGTGRATNLRPGIVHRLDKEASGLMIIARTQKMFNHLKDQFKNRTINKEYIALVHNQMPREWDEINFPIARSETADRMAAIPATSGKAQPRTDAQSASGAREAKTEFVVIKNFVNFSLIRVKIHTGRMHQIRVHLLAYNHPLVGDPLYFQKKQKRVWDEKLGRLFLHSTKLGFNDLSGERQEFDSPLPKELDEFLKLLK